MVGQGTVDDAPASGPQNDMDLGGSRQALRGDAAGAKRRKEAGNDPLITLGAYRLLPQGLRIFPYIHKQ
jgi:hypothetical protein